MCCGDEDVNGFSDWRNTSNKRSTGQKKRKTNFTDVKGFPTRKNGRIVNPAHAKNLQYCFVENPFRVKKNLQYFFRKNNVLIRISLPRTDPTNASRVPAEASLLLDVPSNNS